MYEPLPSDIRERHPYHMYDEIKAQPEAVARSLRLAAAHGASITRIIAGARRVFVTGCGTSFYAAQGGAWFLRSFTRGGVDARAVQAYELAQYLPGLRPDDVVVGVSHAGGTTMVLEALERAHRAGCETVIVTGFPESKAGQAARHVLPTGYDQERSWAHTISYTAALTSMAAVANSLAHDDERLDLEPLPQVMAEALQIEEMVHRLAAGVIIAERYREPADMYLIGGGPNEATAREGQLKLLETSYGHALAFELEQMLHGPLAAVSGDSLIIVVAPPGRSTERAVELVNAARRIGVIPIVLVGDDNAASFEEAHRLILPDVPEVISPIPCVVPLQLFAYFLAIGKGLNPDLIRRDDERYLEASAQVH